MAQDKTYRTTCAVCCWMLAGLWAMAFAAGCRGRQLEPLSSVIEAEDLVAHLDAHGPDAEVLVLDVRSEREYLIGHVAGAVRVDPAQWKTESLAAETGLDRQAFWHEKLGRLGIDGRRPVVVYDDGRMTSAARVWFILQYFGVSQPAVLNGGYPAVAPWVASGRIAASREPAAASPTTFQPAGGHRPGIELAGRQRVRKAAEESRAQILDVRTGREYRGLDLRKNPRGGHLPTAVNLTHTELLDSHRRLKSPTELAELLAGAGLQRGRPIITHCDGGGRASLAALAAVRAGYGPVMNYYLSFGDWAADPGCPLVMSEGAATAP